MSEKIIDIGADVEDTYFKRPQQAMASIMDALHTNDKITIRFTEGIALEQLNYKEQKFIDILKDICQQNDWPQDKVHFELPNLVQNKKVWPSISYGGASIMSKSLPENILLGLQAEKVNTEKNIRKTFGMFILRSNWDRLLLASHLYNKYEDISMQTFRKDPTNPGDMLELGIDMLLWKLSSEKRLDKDMINNLTKFLQSLPLKRNIEWDRIHQQSTVDNNIMSWYQELFVDVVCEKMITGDVFFPTEKIARPLISKTPFLVMAAPNYIRNLKRLGFKSFNRWWDESYDYQQGLQRVESICKIIDELATLRLDDIKRIYDEMKPILEHNHKIYINLTADKIKTAFQV